MDDFMKEIEKYIDTGYVKLYKDQYTFCCKVNGEDIFFETVGNVAEMSKGFDNVKQFIYYFKQAIEHYSNGQVLSSSHPQIANTWFIMYSLWLGQTMDEDLVNQIIITRKLITEGKQIIYN
jgi:hypothetical protein